MAEDIGTMAGKVYQLLDQNGEITSTQLARELHGDKKSVERAVGWLAREGKLRFNTEGRSEKICLCSSAR